MYFLGCKGLPNDKVGAARGTVFQEVRPGDTGDFVREKLGGATEERITFHFCSQNQPYYYWMRQKAPYSQKKQWWCTSIYRT